MSIAQGGRIDGCFPCRWVRRLYHVAEWGGRRGGYGGLPLGWWFVFHRCIRVIEHAGLEGGQLITVTDCAGRRGLTWVAMASGSKALVLWNQNRFSWAGSPSGGIVLIEVVDVPGLSLLSGSRSTLTARSLTRTVAIGGWCGHNKGF